MFATAARRRSPAARRRGLLPLAWLTSCVAVSAMLAGCGAAADAPDERVVQLRAGPFGAATVEAAVEILAASGVATYAQAGSAAPMEPVDGPGVGLTLLRDQVRAMALEAHAGGGIEGAELDDLVDTEPDLAPPSYILAGYVAAVDTDGARAARALMGEQDWENAPHLVFPQLVLVLFTADVVRAQMADAAGMDAAGPYAAGPYAALGVPVGQAVGQPAQAAAQSGPCTQVSEFISGALRSVFDRLRLGEASSGAANIFITIWNFVVSVLEDVVTGIVRAFEQRVLDAIGRVAAVVGTVATIVSAVRPWTVTVTPDPFVTTKGIAGAQPPQQGRFVARVDLGGLDDWPDWAKDCAQRAGRPLPDLTPEGSEVTWHTLRQNPPGLVQEGIRREVLDAQGAAQLDFTTGIDDVTDPYRTIPGIVSAHVTIERQALRDLLQVVENELWSELPSIVVGALEPFLRPSIDRVRANLGRLLSAHSSGPAVVMFHIPGEDPDGSPEPPGAGQASDGDCPFAPLADVSRIVGQDGLELGGHVRVSATTAGCTFLPGNGYFYFIEAHRGVDTQRVMATLREQHGIGRDSTMSEVPVATARGTAYFYQDRIFGLVQAAAVDGDRVVLVMAMFLELSPEGHVALLELALDRLAAGHGP
jgi:hypothetical protein